MTYRLASAVGPCRYKLPCPEAPLAQSLEVFQVRMGEVERKNFPKAQETHLPPAPRTPRPPPPRSVPSSTLHPPGASLGPSPPDRRRTRDPRPPSDPVSPRPSTPLNPLMPQPQLSLFPQALHPRTRMCPSSSCPVPPDRTGHLTEPRCPLSHRLTRSSVLSPWSPLDCPAPIVFTQVDHFRSCPFIYP